MCIDIWVPSILILHFSNQRIGASTSVFVNVLGRVM